MHICIKSEHLLSDQGKKQIRISEFGIRRKKQIRNNGANSDFGIRNNEANSDFGFRNSEKKENSEFVLHFALNRAKRNKGVSPSFILHFALFMFCILHYLCFAFCILHFYVLRSALYARFFRLKKLSVSVMLKLNMITG